MRQDPLKRILASGHDHPDKPAIEHAGRVMTYGELTDVVQKVAAHLRSLGAEANAVSGESPVGIAMPPSIELVATVLAVQRAGYPYLPLPLEEVPATRRDAIIADGKPWLIIADDLQHWAASGVAKVRSWKDISESNDPLDRKWAGGLEFEDLGYLIYTSGSTGSPKGVEMRWGALSNLIAWQASEPRLGRPARTALLTPLTFDVSFQEIFGTLTSGGTLVVLAPALRRDPIGLAQALRAARIERIFLPFVGLQSLAEAATSFAAVPTTLVDVVTAGEQLKVTPAITDFFTRLKGAALHNHYGPAEAHVVTSHVLKGDPGQWPEVPPIGTPITGVEVILLDKEGKKVAPGVEGELMLGGACLARGYRNLPDETDARFVSDPRSAKPRRLYRTGDIGRRKPDGAFEWVGRIDDQVKIRGHRVELGEVESVLSRHEQVRQIVVVPRRSGVSNELVAYVLADTDAELSEDAASEVLQTWRGVWDRTYAEDTPDPDPTFDTSGWNSSLTGERIPDRHMREWVDGAVARILALKPQRVLEVGCGSGLLLHRIARHCEHYAGLDYAQQVIDRLSGVLAKQSAPPSSVSLTCASAHELRESAGGTFDLIIMNSVLQHFPSPDYLLDVIEQAVSVTAPSGRLFIGDITPNAFREAFFAWLEAPEDCADPETATSIRNRVQRRLELDRELTLDPPFFDLLRESVSRITRVEIQLKRGKERNELTDFRYDVILHLDGPGEPAKSKTLEWAALDESSKSVDGLIQLVRSGVSVRSVPNERSRVPWQRADDLSGHARLMDETFIDPQMLFSTADQQSVALEIRPATGSRTFTVAGAGALSPVTSVEVRSVDRQELLRRLSAYASNPLRDRTARKLFPRLRELSAQQLPDYMRPAAYVLMQAYPRTASGKIDRRRLPAPGHGRPELSTSYSAPRTEIEKTTERIWRDVLSLDQIGIDDSFFDLGGNSAGVVSLAARLGSELGRAVPVLAIFEHPTVRTLAASLERQSSNPDDSGSCRDTRGGQIRNAYRQRRNRRVQRGQH